MLSFISLHKENWRSHSYAAARCVGDQVLFQMLKANSNIDTVCLCICGSFAMSDKSCVYTFREDGSGELRLSGAPYKFRFTLSGRTLSIDFEAEALTDCEYEVAYIDTGLELTAGKGTATQGEKFTLNRTEK